MDAHVSMYVASVVSLLHRTMHGIVSLDFSRYRDSTCVCYGFFKQYITYENNRKNCSALRFLNNFFFLCELLCAYGHHHRKEEEHSVIIHRDNINTTILYSIRYDRAHQKEKIIKYVWLFFRVKVKIVQRKIIVSFQNNKIIFYCDKNKVKRIRRVQSVFLFNNLHCFRFDIKKKSFIFVLFSSL